MVDRPYDRRWAAARRAAVFVLLLGMAALAKPNPAGVTVGFALCVAGEAVRLWAAGHLLKTRELVTSGPYRFTRNPLYLGRLLIFAGVSTMASMPYRANWAILIAGLAVFFGYYLPRKERVEPARLRAAHGEAYERYRRAVPALFPTLRPYADGSGAGWSSDRMLRNREHWMVVGIVLLSLALLYRAYSFEAPADAPPPGPPPAPLEKR